MHCAKQILITLTALSLSLLGGIAHKADGKSMKPMNRLSPKAELMQAQKFLHAVPSLPLWILSSSPTWIQNESRSNTVLSPCHPDRSIMGCEISNAFLLLHVKIAQSSGCKPDSSTWMGVMQTQKPACGCTIRCGKTRSAKIPCVEIKKESDFSHLATSGHQLISHPTGK